MLCHHCNEKLLFKHCTKKCRENQLFKTHVLEHDPILVSFNNNSYVKYIKKKDKNLYVNFNKYLSKVYTLEYIQTTKRKTVI